MQQQQALCPEDFHVHDTQRLNCKVKSTFSTVWPEKIMSRSVNNCSVCKNAEMITRRVASCYDAFKKICECAAIWRVTYAQVCECVWIWMFCTLLILFWGSLFCSKILKNALLAHVHKVAVLQPPGGALRL